MGIRGFGGGRVGLLGSECKVASFVLDGVDEKKVRL